MQWDVNIHWAINKYHQAIIQPAQQIEHGLKGQFLEDWAKDYGYVYRLNEKDELYVMRKENVDYLPVLPKYYIKAQEHKALFELAHFALIDACGHMNNGDPIQAHNIIRQVLVDIADSVKE